MRALLEVDDVTVRFGGVVALDGLSFTIDDGQLCALIGPNGAGKTTFFNVVSRIYLPTTGHVRFAGQDLLAVPAHRIAKVGITRTFQNLALFPGLSVLQNVMVGAHSWTSGGFVGAMLGVPQWGADRRRRAEAYELLERLGLAQFANRPAAGLPYGTLKRIELARALASRPKLLMLDEPASGLTHAEVDELAMVIQRMRADFGLTILLVEHHMGMVMSISEKVVVMEFGKKIAEGTAQQVANDPAVIEAYLGGIDLVTDKARAETVPRMGDVLLEARGLTAGYGPVQVLHGLDFRIHRGEIVVILGANGAGKTTTIRAVCGMIASRGDLVFAGDRVGGKRPEVLCKLGMAHVPQGRGTFPELTVEENLRIGAFTRSDGEVSDDVDRWYQIFPRLRERHDQAAGSMSGGEQQMLAIARALMSRPQLLLLDEPSLGLAPMVTQEVFARLADINRTLGTTVLVVEQNANLALGIANRGYVLETGQIVLAGSADELRADESVRRAYLGF